MSGSVVQEIEIGAQRAVVVPLETWEALVGRLAELEDERAFDRSIALGSKADLEHDELSRRLGRSPLRYLRLRAGMTQAELARRARLSQAFVARLEGGDKRPSDSSRRRLARALRVAVEKLSW